MAICTGTQYTDRILKTQCIGNSLNTINANFQNLDVETCRLDNEIIALQNTLGAASPHLCGLRLSLDANTPVPSTNIRGVNARNLYIHPYKGNVVSLFNTSSNKWNSYHVNSKITVNLGVLNQADTNYDIYLYLDSAGTGFNVEFVPWINNGPAGTPPARAYQDNVIVKSAEPYKRLIGCIRTTVVGESEQTFSGTADGGYHAKQYLWNVQTQASVTCCSFELQEYQIVTPLGSGSLGTGDTGFRRVNLAAATQGKNNRISFLIGDTTVIDAIGQVYAVPQANTNPAVYCAFGVNEEDNPYTATIRSDGLYSQLLGEARGMDVAQAQIIARACLKHTFSAGFHYIQLFERINTGSNGSVINMNDDRSSAGVGGIDTNYHKTGIIATLTN